MSFLVNAKGEQIAARPDEPAPLDKSADVVAHVRALMDREKNLATGHGEQGYGGYANMRRCLVHGGHGLLYICDQYGADLTARIKKDIVRYKALDVTYFAELEARGLPPLMIEAFKRLARETDGTDQS